MSVNPVHATPLADDLAPAHNTAAYSAGQCMGIILALTVPTPFRSGANGPVLLVEELILSIPEALTPDIDVLLFDSLPTAVADHDAYAPVQADLVKIADIIQVRAASAHWNSFGTKRVAVRDALVKVVRMKTPPTLYVLFVARSSVTFATASTLKGKLAGFVN